MSPKSLKAAAVVFALFVCIQLYGQDELHIHHINIENGDATAIGLYNSATKRYTAKVLIDGGQLKPGVRLLPYINRMFGNADDATHFEYVILTHYHNDHYNGLLGLKTGELTADSIVDPGGYNVASYFTHTANKGTPPAALKMAAPWLTAMKTASRHMPEPYVKGRSKILIQYSSGAKSGIGNKLTIGKIGSQKVELQCVAGWGNTLSQNGAIERNPKPSKSNANNFTLAFILSYGEFRYFIGGDMGGETGGNYIDQESAITRMLNSQYPASRPMSGSGTQAGHVCGFKSNHHGSDHSNNALFMESMHPTITITSVGNNKNWHLPHPDYIRRLSRVVPINAMPASGSTVVRGVYFTNLYNFTGFPSKTTATTLFNNKPGISFDFGNNTSTSKASYLIKVKSNTQPEQSSIFEVGRVDLTSTTPYTTLSVFRCHSR